MKHLKRILLILMLAPLVLAFTPGEDSIEGTWTRKTDHLKIEIQKGQALIVREGEEVFPCEIASLSIYKDIKAVKRNHWQCKFLVVTMGSCDTEYQSGELFLNKNGELVVICPGFESKVYIKARPRHES